MARKAPKKSQSWRDIQKNNRRTGKTRSSQKRRWQFFFRSAMVMSTLLIVAIGILGLRYFYSQNTKGLPDGVSEEILTHQVALDFQTDGVLTAGWFSEKFGEHFQDLSARKINVGVLSREIESTGQIKSAKVQIQLPDTLSVSLFERTPVLRVRVRVSGKQAETLLIARDGHVFRGMHYPGEFLRKLPGVVGLKLRRGGNSYLPVPGIEEVARLLDTAKREIPAFSRHWKIVDLENWDKPLKVTEPRIKIHSSPIDSIVFSCGEYRNQISRLEKILEHSHRYQLGMPAMIDLSYLEEVVVRF